MSGWWLNTNRDLSAQIKYMMMVPLAGIEPALLAESDFESAFKRFLDYPQLSHRLHYLIFPIGYLSPIVITVPGVSIAVTTW